MVGVPRSKGCRICVQRRVRCDQTRPTCNNCKKGNRPCPGYGQDLKFQDEGARLRQRFEVNDESSTPSDNDESSKSSTPSINNATSSSKSAINQTPLTDVTDSGNDMLPPIGRSGKDWDVVGLDMNVTARRTFLGLLEGKSEVYAKLAETFPLEYTFDIDEKQVGMIPDRFMLQTITRNNNPFYHYINSPDQNQKQLITTFRQSLFPDNGTLPEALKTHSRWLSHLPPMTGTNPLLDASVRAVTLVHIGRLNNCEPFVMESRPYYGKALKLLNKALQDKSTGTSNETLCAVILLSFYEMFASDNNESWIRHAGGVSALMRARGPQKHRHGFDSEIFLAYRYTLVIEAFQENVPCFLAEPAWIKLSADIHTDLKAAGVMQSRIDIFDLAEEYYASMVKLPELCQHARALWQARLTSSPPPFSRAQVIDNLTEARYQFKSTFTRFETALKKAGHAPTVTLASPDPVIGVSFDYINTFVSATYTGYWTVLTVLNLCLSGLHASDPELVSHYKIESRECALNICRSTASMLTSSFLGPFFLIFGLRVALLYFEDEDGPEADWVVRKLFAIGDRHMGIAKHIPGYRTGITVDELIEEFRERRATVNQQRDIKERMNFADRVAKGDISEDKSGGNGADASNTDGEFQAFHFADQEHFEDFDGVSSSPASNPSFNQNGNHQQQRQQQWPVFNHISDVQNAWENQDTFDLHANMNDLNVNSNSEHPNATEAPISTENGMQHGLFSQSAPRFAMPDMNFFDMGGLEAGSGDMSGFDDFNAFGDTFATDSNMQMQDDMVVSMDDHGDLVPERQQQQRTAGEGSAYGG